MDEITISGDVKVSLSYKWSETYGGDKIELTHEVCFPGDDINYYDEITITLNREDAIKLVEFIRANLDKLK